MKPSTIRGIVGTAGFVAAAIGLGLYSIPLALTVCGLVLLVVCIWGELR